MKKIIVDKKYDGKKLSKIILNKIKEINYNTFCKLLRKKDIKVNGRRINKDIPIYENDEIIAYIQDSHKNVNSDNEKELNVIYEDDNIIVINKPENLEVTGQDSLTQILHKKYKNSEFRPMPCHRIDRNTKGLVLFAKNKEALEILLNKFKNHEIEKHYIALVYGIPKEKNKKMQDYLFKDNKKSRVYISDKLKKGYQKIITKYSVIEERKENNICLLDVEIETGKTHQIRAHLSYIGHPIIGDGKYGKNEINKKFNKKYQQLYSYKLIFRFCSDSRILEYLNNKEIEIKKEVMKNIS